MSQKVEVELVAKDGGFFAMLAKGIRGFQEFAEKGKASTTLANTASKEHLATIEKLEARVRSLTQEWMKLKAQQVGGDTSKVLNDKLRDVNRELAGAGRDVARMKASALAPDPSQMEPGIASLRSLAGNALGAYVSIEALRRGVQASVDGTIDWVKSSVEMANTLGISSEKASALKLAIGDVYATEEEFSAAVGKVTQALNKKEEAFAKLGVATRDANGNLRPTVDILLDTNTALGKLKSGTDRNVAANAIFGKSWQDMQRVMQLNNTVMQEAEAKAARLGLIVGGDLVEATNRFRAAQNDAEDTFQAMKIAVGQELLPVLTDFNQWAAEDGPQSLGVLSGAIRVVITVWKTLVFIVQTVGAVVGTIIGQIITNVTALGDILWKVFTGDFKGAGAAAKRWWQDTKNNLSAGADEIADRFEKLGMSLNQVWDPNLRPKGSTAPKGGGKRGETFKEDKGADPYEAYEAQMKAEAAIRKERRALWEQHQNDLFEMFGSALDREERQINQHHDAMLQHARQFGADQAILDQIELEREVALQNARTDAAAKASEKRRQIEREEYEERNKYNGWAGAMSALDDILAKGQNRFDQFKDFTNDIFSGMEQGYLAALNGMVTGQMTPMQALKAGAATFGASIAQALMKIGAQEAALWSIQKAKALWERQAQIQKLAGNSAEIASSVAKTAASTTETGANTGAAVSGFTKAHAGIPFVGWAIALGFIVAFLGLMSSLKARAVGGRVSGPEVTLLGEKGPEIVAPESDFQDYTAGIFRMGMNLQANLGRRQSMIAAYDAEASGFARRASGYAASAPAGGGRGGDTYQLSFPGMQVWDRSDRGKEQFGDWCMDAIQVAAQRRGQVLAPGSAGASF